MKLPRIFKSGFDYLVYSNIFIALGAAAYTAKTSLVLYGNNGNLHVNTIVFCATLFWYCFHRINKKKFLIPAENMEERNNWMYNHRNVYYVLLAASLTILLTQLVYMPLRVWIVFVPACFVVLGYTFPIIYTGKTRKRLGDIYWLKTLWVAFVFSWLTTLLPVVYTESLSSLRRPEVAFIFCRSLLFTFAICTPFDIRDIHFDKLKGIKTLPVRVGVNASIYIAIILLLIFVVLVGVDYLLFSLNLKTASALFISAIITIITLPVAKIKRPALVFPILYDGAMLVQWLSLFVLMHL